jgi:hypothetical protein
VNARLAPKIAKPSSAATIYELDELRQRHGIAGDLARGTKIQTLEPWIRDGHAAGHPTWRPRFGHADGAWPRRTCAASSAFHSISAGQSSRSTMPHASAAREHGRFRVSCDAEDRHRRIDEQVISSA